MLLSLNSNLPNLYRGVNPPSKEWFQDYLHEQLRIGSEWSPYGSYLNVTAEAFSLGFVEVLSHSYSLHRNICIQPQDLWFIVLTEIAKIVKSAPEQCRSLFTRTNNTQYIVVPVSSIEQLNLRDVHDQLSELVNVDIDTFAPTLSTETPASRVAFMGAFADTVQNYYNYSTFMCGIPAVKITGTAQDWRILVESSHKISELFDKIQMYDAASYMHRVTSTLTPIAEVIECSDINQGSSLFMNMFTQGNIGSGRQLQINGWVTNLFYDGAKHKYLDNYLFSAARIPYKNLNTGQEFLGVYGAFERTFDGIFITSEFSSVIFKKS